MAMQSIEYDDSFLSISYDGENDGFVDALVQVQGLFE